MIYFKDVSAGATVGVKDATAGALVVADYVTVGATVGALVLIAAGVVIVIFSGVARAFPGGRVAHPEGQNEEENKKSLRKNKKN